MGHGEDVVLVHGVGVSARYWAPLQEELAATGRFRVHAVDLPGFGRSADPPWKPELPRYAEHLGAWLGQAVPGRFHLVGQSLGCEIAAMCAATCPERIHSLTLAAPSGLPTLRSLLAQLGRALLDAPHRAAPAVPESSCRTTCGADSGGCCWRCWNRSGITWRSCWRSSACPRC